ncbi:MAG: cupin domain-containing protein [Candidatus Binatia bacterium]
MSAQESQVLRFQDDYSWTDVEPESYKDGQEAGRAWRNIIRQVLVGKHTEATNFHLRYFEIAPNGYSSLEKHGHAHVVITVRGRGRAVLGETSHKLKPFDVIYVAPWTPHQFLANSDEPFGFFCIVDAERDRPQSVSST